MTNEIINQNMSDKLQSVLIEGDLSKLTPEERVLYYNKVCESMGLNSLTSPFKYIELSQKVGNTWVKRLVLYATRNCTDQLRAIHKISITPVSDEVKNGLFCVKVKARMPDGREDTELGAVAVQGLSGDNLANALMRGMTKAKRRATLSIVGLSILDETEIQDIPIENKHPRNGGDINVKKGRLKELPEDIQSYLRAHKYGVNEAFLFCDVLAWDEESIRARLQISLPKVEQSTATIVQDMFEGVEITEKGRV